MSLIEKALMKSQKEVEPLGSSISPNGEDVLGGTRKVSRKRMLLGVCLVLFVCVAGAWLLMEWLPLLKDTFSKGPSLQRVQREVAQRPGVSLEVGSESPGSEPQEVKRPTPDVPQGGASALGEPAAGLGSRTKEEGSKKAPFPSQNPVRETPIQPQVSTVQEKTSQEMASKPLKKDAGQRPAHKGPGPAPSQGKQGGSSKEPPRREFLLEKAFLSAQLGHHSEALKAYDELIKMNPKDVDARINRAILKSRLGDLSSAKEDLMVAREIKPDDPLLLNALGVITMEKGDLDEAMGWFLRSSDPISTINLALVYWKKGEEEQALRLLSEAEARLPQEPKVPYYRALLLKEMGRLKESGQELQRARGLAKKKGDMEILRRVDELSFSP